MRTGWKILAYHKESLLKTQKDDSFHITKFGFKTSVTKYASWLTSLTLH